MESCCRQSMMKLGGTVYLVNRWWSSFYSHSSVHLSWAKLITRFDDGYAEAKFSKSRVWVKVPEQNAMPLLWRYPNFLSTQCRIGEMPKTCWNHSAISTELRLVTERDTGPQFVPTAASIMWVKRVAKCSCSKLSSQFHCIISMPSEVRSYVSVHPYVVSLCTGSHQLQSEFTKLLS